jgi:N-acetylneuraminate synthase
LILPPFMKEDDVFMVAEIGINHNSSMYLAKKLIDATFACGWDCVKFQKRNPDKCVPESQKGIIRDTPWGKMTYIEYKHKMEFGKEEYDYIDKYCREKPLLWSASVWDLDSLRFINSYDVPFIKIPSAKITDHDLLHAAGETGKPIILSTGMSTKNEIDDAVWILEKYVPKNFSLMHTNSTYPSPYEDINLNVIPYLRQRYGRLTGYSGHEQGLEPTVAAVVLGARIIERHITIDHDMWGTDQAASLEVHAMDLLRKRIKAAYKSLGTGVKVITESELKIREKLR